VAPTRRRLAFCALAVLAAVVTAGCTTPASNNEPPVAEFALAKPVVDVNEPVVFNGSASSDAEGKLITLQWNFGDGSPPEAGAVVVHRYGLPGQFNVTLTVTDEQGAQNARAQTLTVNAPPIAALDVPPGPYFAKEPITFSAAGSRDPDGRIDAYLWDLGDGSTATTPTVAHAFLDTGVYNVRLDVVDDHGTHANATASLFVDIHTFEVEFAEQTSQQPAVRNFTLANQTKTITLEIFEHNLTRVNLTLTWRDPLPVEGPPNDVIQIKVISPDGPSQTAVGDFDNVSLTFNLNPVPGAVQVRAATAADVPGVLGDAYVGLRGVGVWVVEITPLTLGGGLVQDQGFVPEPFFFWTLTTTLSAYAAVPQQIA
jgi:PKD repeat protein